jgi:hypothetical protein
MLIWETRVGEVFFMNNYWIFFFKNPPKICHPQLSERHTWVRWNKIFFGGGALWSWKKVHILVFLVILHGVFVLFTVLCICGTSPCIYILKSSTKVCYACLKICVKYCFKNVNVITGMSLFLWFTANSHAS